MKAHCPSLVRATDDLNKASNALVWFSNPDDIRSSELSDLFQFASTDKDTIVVQFQTLKHKVSRLSASSNSEVATAVWLWLRRAEECRKHLSSQRPNFPGSLTLQVEKFANDTLWSVSGKQGTCHPESLMCQAVMQCATETSLFTYTSCCVPGRIIQHAGY